MYNIVVHISQDFVNAATVHIILTQRMPVSESR